MGLVDGVGEIVTELVHNLFNAVVVVIGESITD